MVTLILITIILVLAALLFHARLQVSNRHGKIDLAKVDYITVLAERDAARHDNEDAEHWWSFWQSVAGINAQHGTDLTEENALLRKKLTDLKTEHRIDHDLLVKRTKALTKTAHVSE